MSFTCGVFRGDDGAVFFFVSGLELVAHALVDGSGGVEPGRARSGGNELLAGVEVALPGGADHLGDGFAVRGQPGGLEQVGVVADGLGAGVGAVADELAVLGGGRFGLPVQPAALNGGVLQIGELLRELLEFGQPVDLDAFDVRQTRSRREACGQVVARLIGGGRLLVLDRDVRVEGLVLREELLVPEFVERRDGQGYGVFARFAGGAGALGGAASARAQGQGKAGCCRGERGELTGVFHVRDSFVMGMWERSHTYTLAAFGALCRAVCGRVSSCGSALTTMVRDITGKVKVDPWSRFRQRRVSPLYRG